MSGQLKFLLTMYAGIWTGFDILLTLFHPGSPFCLFPLFEKLRDFFIYDIRPRFFPNKFEKLTASVVDNIEQSTALLAAVERLQRMFRHDY
jgi:hypothetical protein